MVEDENEGRVGTGDDGGKEGIVPDAQKNSAGATPAKVDQGANVTGGGRVGTFGTREPEPQKEADPARHAGLDAVGRLYNSGLDHSGQFHVADKLTISVEADKLRLRVTGLGSVKVDEFDLYDAIEKAFFSENVKRD